DQPGVAGRVERGDRGAVAPEVAPEPIVHCRRAVDRDSEGGEARVAERPRARGGEGAPPGLHADAQAEIRAEADDLVDVVAQVGFPSDEDRLAAPEPDERAADLEDLLGRQLRGPSLVGTGARTAVVARLIALHRQLPDHAERLGDLAVLRAPI